MNETLISVLIEKVKAKEAIEKEIADIKAAIEAELPEEGFKNELVTIVRRKPSESTSIDLKALEKNEPQLYEDLVRDYTKVTKKPGSISYNFKKDKE